MSKKVRSLPEQMDHNWRRPALVHETNECESRSSATDNFIASECYTTLLYWLPSRDHPVNPPVRAPKTIPIAHAFFDALRIKPPCANRVCRRSSEMSMWCLMGFTLGGRYIIKCVNIAGTLICRSPGIFGRQMESGDLSSSIWKWVDVCGQRMMTTSAILEPRRTDG